MKPAPLTCPHAEYGDGMRVFCRRANDYCGHQYYKRCKGWWALTDQAGRCPLREERKDGEEHPTGEGDSLAV